MSVFDYLGHSGDRVLSLLGEHLVLAVTPIVLALVLSIPLGWFASRRPSLTSAMLSLGAIAYSIPSLALFVLLPPIFGYRTLTYTNIIVALTIYACALLIRNVVDGLQSVPEDVLLSATAMGYGRLKRLLFVELPIGVPVIAAGLRVVSVTTVSMVSVGALIGVGGLGMLFTEGFQRNNVPPLVVGIVLSVLLALTLDALLVLAQRLLTPWMRVGAAR